MIIKHPNDLHVVMTLTLHLWSVIIPLFNISTVTERKVHMAFLI